MDVASLQGWWVPFHSMVVMPWTPGYEDDKEHRSREINWSCNDSHIDACIEEGAAYVVFFWSIPEAGALEVLHPHIFFDDQLTSSGHNQARHRRTSSRTPRSSWLSGRPTATAPRSLDDGRLADRPDPAPGEMGRALSP